MTQTQVKKNHFRSMGNFLIDHSNETQKFSHFTNSKTVVHDKFFLIIENNLNNFPTAKNFTMVFKYLVLINEDKISLK